MEGARPGEFGERKWLSALTEGGGEGEMLFRSRQEVFQVCVLGLNCNANRPLKHVLRYSSAVICRPATEKPWTCNGGP